MTAAPAPVRVRLATADDADVLASLLAEMDDKPSHADSAEAIRGVLAEMAGYPDFRCYLVLDGDMPVGTFSLLTFRSPSHRGSKQALLDAVVVTHTRRGQGIGETMLDEAMRIAAQAGCYKLALSSNLKRMDAHRFYEASGFVQHGISFAIGLKG